MEIYKDIEGYEGLYQVSNLGNVKSLDRYNIDKNGKKKFYPGKQCKFDSSSSKVRITNYYRVTLSKNGKTKRFQVHRLVAITFIENVENKPYVNHIDNDGTNNTVENLEWCTHSENMVHSQKQGRQFANQSKAGKTAAQNTIKKLIAEVEADIGTTVGVLTITGYYGFHKGKHNATCKCGRCGEEVHVDYRDMFRRVRKRCSNCRYLSDKDISQE